MPSPSKRPAKSTDSSSSRRTSEPWRSWPLWPHQREAIRVASAFIAKGGSRVGQSALIRMPTGTGKTAVIGVLVHTQLATEDALVVTPWDALADQLVSDLTDKLWRDMGHPQAWPKKAVKRLVPSTAADLLAEEHEPTVWVATTATIQMLRADEDATTYEALTRAIGMVVIDEGHYEPARKWADAIRGLGVPSVLLTATPYRNDYKFFRIDPGFCYQFSHAKAEQLGYLRAPHFEARLFDDPESFCDALLPFVDSVLADNERVIVRCASKDQVQRVAAALAGRGRSVIGIHERFPAERDAFLRRRVPSPLSETARFWVHQNKLTEGIDDPNFRLLAIYQAFTNERALVQQIGRVLRNPGLVPNAAAWVFSRQGFGIEESWAAYGEYDDLVGDGTPVSPLELAMRQPPIYLSGRFRSSFDLPEARVGDFVFNRTVRVCRVPSAFDLERFDEEVLSGLAIEDAETARVEVPEPNAVLHAYLVAAESPLLARQAFIETKLAACLYLQVDDLLFFWDSRGWAPESLKGLPKVSGEALRRMFPSTAALSDVSLMNLDVGAHSVRRRSLRAQSLAALAPDLSEHAQFPSTVKGRASRQDPLSGRTIEFTRYVGLTRARVSDPGETDFEGFTSWIKELASLLRDTKRHAPAVFERWAEVLDVPTETRPESLLLDFDQSLFAEVSATRNPLTIEDLAMAVDPKSGEFTITANGQAYTATIRWVPKSSRYELACQDLDEAFASNAPLQVKASQTLIDYLNSEQAFRVVTVGGNNSYTVYANGSFSRPRLPISGAAGGGRGRRLELMNVLVPIKQFTRIASEKGGPKSAAGTGWDQSSMFGLIDRLGKGSELATYMKGIDLLVCDDMGTEVCDFFALDHKNKRVIAMHAKAYSTAHPRSASALHEVTSQAIKNLAYLQPFFVSDPPNLARWDSPWASEPVGVVDHRIRQGTLNGTQAWDEIREALRDPSWTRQVWVMLGNGLSKTTIEQDRDKTKTPAETIQVLYSLQSLWAGVSSVGAQLMVFCTP